VEGSCEHGNEPSDSIKCWKVLEYQFNYNFNIILSEGEIVNKVALKM
jgi:hypothetical protein